MSQDKGPNNPDLDKVKTIINTLREFPEGIWLRKLSRESSIPVSTLHYYINNVISPFVESEGAKDKEGKFFGIRLIKLRDGIKKQIESGKSIEYLLRTKDILTQEKD